MIKYSVYNNTDKKNYGICDILKKGPCLRNLGAISQNGYMFEVGITNPSVKKFEFEKQIGDFNLMLSVYSNSTNIRIVFDYVERHDKEDINLFQYETILGILEECKGFEDDFQRPLKINLPKDIFKSSKMDKVIIYPYDQDVIYDFEKDFYEIKDMDTIVEELKKLKEELRPSKEENKVFRLLPFKKNK